MKKSIDTTSVTARIRSDIVREVDDIAECMFSNRTSILQQCLFFGIEELKKQRPELVELLRQTRHRRKSFTEDKKEEKKRAG